MNIVKRARNFLRGLIKNKEKQTSSPSPAATRVETSATEVDLPSVRTPRPATGAFGAGARAVNKYSRKRTLSRTLARDSIGWNRSRV